MRILIVDDSEVFVKVTSQIISDLGIKGILTAFSGEEALSKIDQQEDKGEPVDLVLLDVMMPGIGGIEALNRIKSKYPNKKVFMISANKNTEDIMKAYKEDCDGYLLKPVKPEQMKRIINKVSNDGP